MTAPDDAPEPAPAPPTEYPLRPILLVNGVVRFKSNPVVDFLLKEASAGRRCDLNDLAHEDFPRWAREEFAQLIGYSVSGFGDLSYVRDATYERAADLAYQVVMEAGVAMPPAPPRPRAEVLEDVRERAESVAGEVGALSALLAELQDVLGEGGSDA